MRTGYYILLLLCYTLLLIDVYCGQVEALEN